MPEYRVVTPDMISIVKGLPPCDDTGWWCVVVRDWCRTRGLLFTDHRHD